MKILDSSVVIAFYTELGSPETLFKFIDLGYKLCLPNAVFCEIKKGATTFAQLEKSIGDKKIILLQSVSDEEIINFKNRHPYLGNGEIEVLLNCLRLRSKGVKSYCILDDRKARTVAEKYKLPFTGTVGLIEMLNMKNAINGEERFKLLSRLKSSRFRI